MDSSGADSALFSQVPTKFANEKLMPPAKRFVRPTVGLVITSQLTGNTYTMGDFIGEEHFGIVYSCKDEWQNDLAAKVLKPSERTYEVVRAAAIGEFQKLVHLRHPNITYIYDAFEYCDTFYIITERCYGPISNLFSLSNFNGLNWLVPIARCLLQAVHFLHINHIAHQDIHLGNVFTSFVKDEMPTNEKAIQFKLGDLGVSKVFNELNPNNTRAMWMLPPEVIKPGEFGPIDHRSDIYHVGLLLLQLAVSKELSFTQDEIMAGKPRELAEILPAPLNFALAKALRRHTSARTSSAMELWRDLRVPTQEPPQLNLPLT